MEEQSLALFQAISTNEDARVEVLLNEHPELARTRNANGLSPLMLALYRRKEPLARRIGDVCGDLEVFEAAALGDEQKLRKCLGANPSAALAEASDGFTPLHLAAFFGRVGAVRILLEHGAPPNRAATNPSQVQPLHSAAASGCLATMRALLEGGANPNGQQHGGFTALQSRAAHGDLDGVKLLLEFEADPSIRSDDGRTAAEMAAEKGHLEIVALLKRHMS